MEVPLFKLEAFFEEYEFAEDMIALGSSDAQTLTLAELLALADESFSLSNIPLSYQDVKGDASLRAAVAEMYQPADITAENVLITTGASEAIFLAFHALLEPRDVALVCRPVFQSVQELPFLIGAKSEFYDYVRHDDFRPDLAVVHDAMRGPSRPKLLFINTPHNPTGRAIDATDLRALLAEARTAGVSVVINEMYSGVWLPSTTPIPSALTFDSEAIVIAGLSKVFGLGGLRIGWVIGPTNFIQRCKEWRYYTTLAPPAILQKLGEIAVRNRAIILGRTQRIVQQNYEMALRWLNDRKDDFETVVPDAGQLMLIRLKRDIDTDQFARELAEKASVLLIPCTSCFDMPQGYLRLGLGIEPSRFIEGLERLSNFLKSDETINRAKD